mgnify:CR=1 FL=1
MKTTLPPLILIRGGGDLASGAALRLHRSGFGVVITEIAQPLAVRRAASFSEAVFQGEAQVEGVEAGRCDDEEQITAVIAAGKIAVRVDASAACARRLQFLACVEGRMLKSPLDDLLYPGLFTVGLGPGFNAGKNCHAVVETNRGPFLGRVYWHGSAQEDTAEPEAVKGHGADRVLRARRSGTLTTLHEIGEMVEAGEPVCRIEDEPVIAPFRAVIRGLLRNGMPVQAGMKVGDLDPRCDRSLCFIASDKALAVGGGVLEALLSSQTIRQSLRGHG